MDVRQVVFLQSCAKFVVFSLTDPYVHVKMHMMSSSLGYAKTRESVQRVVEWPVVE